MTMMAAGLERQLTRCEKKETRTDFCKDSVVFHNVLDAYNHVWDLMDKNSHLMHNEVWSWDYNKEDGTFEVRSMNTGDEVRDIWANGDGAWAAVEGNALQLWSLGFLGVKRKAFDFSGNTDRDGVEVWPKDSGAQRVVLIVGFVLGRAVRLLTPVILLLCWVACG